MREQVLSVRETAEVLGVSPQRVRQMLLSGDLSGRRSAAGWIVSSPAVQSRLARVSVGRPCAATTAWAVITLLTATAASAGEGGVPAWADAIADRRLRYRARRLLSSLPDPAQSMDPWAKVLGARGRASRVWAHPGVVERLAVDDSCSRGGDFALPPSVGGLTGGPQRLVVYTYAPTADDLFRRYRLREDPDGQVVLVVVPVAVPVGLGPRPGSSVPVAAVAADLLDEDDPRAREAGLHQLRLLYDAAARAVTSATASAGAAVDAATDARSIPETAVDR